MLLNEIRTKKTKGKKHPKLHSIESIYIEHGTNQIDYDFELARVENEKKQKRKEIQDEE